MNTELFQTYHWQVWNWLAENPTKGKSEWPGWLCEELRAIVEEHDVVSCSMCFACAVRTDLKGDANLCGAICPIKNWSFGTENVLGTPCLRSGTMYARWKSSRNLVIRKQLAIAIADAWE